MKIPYTKHTLFTSFDRTVSLTTLHQRPDRIRMLEEINPNIQIPRGAGLSYVPASFGCGTLVRELSCFNRILEFDREEKTVVVEPGITLEKLLEWSFQEKLYLPVQPGYPKITIGGCIAANVHGKNPLKYGSFKDHVVWLELFYPQNCSKIIVEPNSELFNATCGGLGLTGIITKVKLQLCDLPSDRITIETIKVNSILDSVRIFDTNSDSEILYGWHDGSLLNFGKGFVQVGTFSKGFSQNKLIISSKTSFGKTRLPISLWGKSISYVFNSMYRNMEIRKRKIEKNIFASFFPLSGISQWFYTLYGKKGFREYQILVPRNNLEEFMFDLINLLKKEKPNLLFIGLKPFKGNQKFLQYCTDGISNTLIFNNSLTTNQFLVKLDDLIISYRVLPYIIKDSRLTRNVVAKCYPQYDEFYNILRKVDPGRVFKSYVSEQLGL